MRGMSIVSVLLYFLKEINEKFSTRLFEARGMKDNNLEVTAKIVNIVKDNGRITFERKKWRYSLSSIEFSTNSLRDVEKVSFLLEKQPTLSTPLTTQFVISFFPNKENWKERILCSRCSYFVAFGMPCFHAAFILQKLVNTRQRSAKGNMRFLAGKTKSYK